MSDRTSHRDRLPTVLLAVGSIGFLVAVWLSRPATSGNFPKATQDGLGLLLAALVFVLGFARDAQRRISAAALETFHRNHDVLLDAWASRDLRLTSVELVDFALRRVSDAAQFSRLADEAGRKENRRLVALSDQRDAIRAQETQLALLLGYRRDVVGHAERSAADPDYVIPDFYRAGTSADLERLRREIPRIEKDHALVAEKWRLLEEARGVGTAELVTGPARIRLATTTQTLMQNAHRFVAGMTLLYVAGIIHAGPSLELLGSPELWAATLVMVVAVTYVRLVTRDVKSDLRFTAESVDQLPLIVLARMELALFAPDFLSAEEAGERAVEFWKKHGWWLLRVVEVQAPGFSWTDSVRGRFELALALMSGIHADRQLRDRNEHLLQAEQNLQRVPDDPLALVALARTREELGNSEAVASPVSSAAELLQRSRHWRPGEGWDRTLTVATLLKGQWWLWPISAEAVNRLTRVAAAREEEEKEAEGGRDPRQPRTG